MASVERFIEKNRLPHLLFYGPPGTGKTSTILAVARRIYGADYRKQILEVWDPQFVPKELMSHFFSSTHLTNVVSTLFVNKSNNLPKQELYSQRASNLSFWTKPT